MNKISTYLYKTINNIFIYLLLLCNFKKKIIIKIFLKKINNKNYQIYAIILFFL